tara:strand:+ start:71 stop:502 length:432 start_codon:yes stop_codon:yes gene_type:complete
VIDGYYAEVFFEGDTLNTFNRRLVEDHMNSLGVEAVDWLDSKSDTNLNYIFTKEELVALTLNDESYISFKGIPEESILGSLTKQQNVILRKGDGKAEVIKKTLLNKEIILDSSIPEWDYDYKKLINEEGVYSVSKRGFYLKDW